MLTEDSRDGAGRFQGKEGGKKRRRGRIHLKEERNKGAENRRKVIRSVHPGDRKVLRPASHRQFVGAGKKFRKVQTKGI